MNAEKINQHLVGLTYSDIVDRLVIDEDGGDCCGYAHCEENQPIPVDVDKSNLVLKDCIRLDYKDEESDSDGERVVLNFVFGDGERGDLILGYELSAGSGSGWAYGAYVRLSHDGKVLAEASW